MSPRSAHILRSRRRGVATLAALALAVAAAACGGDDDASDVPSTPTDAPGEATPGDEDPTDPPDDPMDPSDETAEPPADGVSRGGSILVVAAGQPPTFDPALQRVSYAFAEAGIMSSIFGQLAFADAETGEVELLFLESIEPNEDSSVWTMRLHPNIRFSDGTPLDAEAVKFNLERNADPETGSRYQQAAERLTLEVLDELTLQVTLPEPDPLFPSDVVANHSGIGSPTAIQAALDEGVEVGSRPVGAGPFMVKEWEPGQSITVERNPYFEDFMPGRPYLDEITFENLTDATQISSALETETAQVALTFGGAHAEEMTERANTVLVRGGGGSGFFLNTQRPPFDDVRARLALAMAVDRVVLSDAFNLGTAPSTGLFPETSPFYNPEHTWPERDVDEAQRLFDELADEGTPVEFTYTTYDTPAQQAVIGGLIAQLAEFENVTFEPDVRTFPEYTAAGVNAEFQTLAWGTFFSNPVPLLVEYYYPGSTLATHGWDNQVVKEAFDGLAEATTVDAQKEIWDVFQRELVNEMPVLWLGESIMVIGYVDAMVVPRSVNLGTYPLFFEVGYAE